MISSFFLCSPPLLASFVVLSFPPTISGLESVRHRLFGKTPQAHRNTETPFPQSYALPEPATQFVRREGLHRFFHPAPFPTSVRSFPLNHSSRPHRSQLSGSSLLSLSHCRRLSLSIPLPTVSTRSHQPANVTDKPIRACPRVCDNRQPAL
jgi:hypothetical protein